MLDFGKSRVAMRHWEVSTWSCICQRDHPSGIYGVLDSKQHISLLQGAIPGVGMYGVLPVQVSWFVWHDDAIGLSSDAGAWLPIESFHQLLSGEIGRLHTELQCLAVSCSFELTASHHGVLVGLQCQRLVLLGMSDTGFIHVVESDDGLDVPIQDIADIVVFGEATDREAGVLKAIVDGLLYYVTQFTRRRERANDGYDGLTILVFVVVEVQ